MVLLEEVQRRRTGLKGWVTRSERELLALVDESDTTASSKEIELAIRDFNRRLEQLDEVQGQLEMLLDDAAMSADIEEADKFRRQARKALVAAEVKLEKLVNRNSTQPAGEAVSSHSLRRVNLPKFELPKFDGDVMQWQSFWDQFSAHIGDVEDLSNAHKLGYLKRCLIGPALRVIDSLQLTNENYEIACENLKTRFGRPEKIIYSHIVALLNLPVPVKNHDYVSQLWNLRDSIVSHVRNLEALEVPSSDCEVFLTPIVLSRLPAELRLEWSREGDGRERDLEFLMAFLQLEIQRLERSEAFKDFSVSHADKSTRPKKPSSNPPSTAALTTTSTSSPATCVFCGRTHRSERCYDVLKLSGAERKLRIEKLGLCYRCLVKGHFASTCSERCSKCNGFHNSLLCGVRIEPKVNVNVEQKKENTPKKKCESEKVAESVQISASDSREEDDGQKCTLLQTAKVSVVGPNGEKHSAKVMFDSGADRVYVSSKFIQKCNPKYLHKEVIPFNAFAGFKSKKGVERDIYELKLLNSQNQVLKFKAAEIPIICEPLTRTEVPKSILNSFSHLPLADDFDENSPLEIDILVGLQMYWDIISVTDAVKVDDVVALNTEFGYVLSGKFKNPQHAIHCTCMSVQMFINSRISATDHDLQKLWSLESIGIVDESKDLTQDQVYKEFLSTVQFKDDRYVVQLPWKNEMKGQLVDNRQRAVQSLHRLYSKLDKNFELREEYKKIFVEYESSGIIEEIDENSLSDVTYYMTHRPVVKMTSLTTKVRPVFQCNIPSTSGISLNDCMETGPSLLPDLVGILIRFRRWPVAITGDITKAFLQIVVDEKDRGAHRFLLKSDEGSIRTMQFTRVPFGNTCSPFLLNATIQFHLDQYEQSNVVKELKENFYVDNWLSGANTVDDASSSFTQAKCILNDASFPLTQVFSNDFSITTQFNEKDSSIFDKECTSVLGLKWISTEDVFTFEGLDFCKISSMKLTKRIVLSFMCKIYDPLGKISPYMMHGKIIFQEIWKLGLDWDENLPTDMQTKVEIWMKSSNDLSQLSINRAYFPGIPWFDENVVEIHGFGDASAKGYGACVYLRIKVNGSYKVALVISKSRVAPIKSITLPKLELLAAFLCAKLVVFVKNSLNLDSSVKLKCWTDSTIVLNWIKGEPSKREIFVANRVRQIQSLVPPSCWSHVEGKVNPADCISRGLLANELVNCSNWWNGPSFLLDDEMNVESPISEELEIESLDEVICVTVTEVKSIDIDRFSNLIDCIRHFSCILRFISNCRIKDPSCRNYEKNFSDSELENAKDRIIYCIQRDAYANEIKNLSSGKSISVNSSLHKLDPFLDDKGLLRVRGRLENSELSYDSKHPIIIPKGHFAKLLVRFQHSLMLHAGVDSLITTLRSTYHIIGLRKLCKTIVRECVQCRRYDSRPCTQRVSPLPALRVTKAPPFTITGTDHAGPVFCLDKPNHKYYILIFTCGVTRSIHLEITDSLSVSDCMLAIRRFVGRRGIPSVMYSDNSKTFHATVNEIQKYYGQTAPKWNFITARSPWHGGWWERLIRSVKTSLRKTLGVKSVSKTELYTILTEIEACVNSRPLTYVGNESNESEVLSPAHFLIGKPFHSKLDVNLDQSSVTSHDIKERMVFRNKLLDKFWSIWSKSYIVNLPPVVKGFKEKCNIEKGSVVLIKEDNIPRFRWPLGVVLETFPGKDGYVRTVKVKTANSTLIRPIQRLHDLEIKNRIVEDKPNDVIVVNEPSDDEPVVNNDDMNSTNVSRYGRTLRQTDRFSS